MDSNIIAFASVIVSFLSVVCSVVVVYIHHVNDMKMYNLNICRERLDKLYIPFYRIHCTSLIMVDFLTELDDASIDQIICLLSKNINYLDTNSQAHLCKIFSLYAEWITSDNSVYKECLAQRLNYSFKKLSEIMLIEYNILLKKCHLPQSLQWQPRNVSALNKYKSC